MDNIKGLIETSFVDWPGRTCAVIFLGGCNFRCPFCHNYPLVLHPAELASYPLAEVIAQLRPLKKWLGGVCVSGGEPTLDQSLTELLETLRLEGFATKIDTNGSQPEVLAELIDHDLLDMVSMDVKTILVQNKYDRCAGTRVNLTAIKKSIELLRNSTIPHEFRMTILPRYHQREDIIAWADELGMVSSLKLQNYNPQSSMYPKLAGYNGFPPDDFAGLTSLVGGGPD